MSLIVGIWHDWFQQGRIQWWLGHPRTTKCRMCPSDLSGWTTTSRALKLQKSPYATIDWFWSSKHVGFAWDRKTTSLVFKLDRNLEGWTIYTCSARFPWRNTFLKSIWWRCHPLLLIPSTPRGLWWSLRLAQRSHRSQFLVGLRIAFSHQSGLAMVDITVGIVLYLIHPFASNQLAMLGRIHQVWCVIDSECSHFFLHGRLPFGILWCLHIAFQLADFCHFRHVRIMMGNVFHCIHLGSPSSCGESSDVTSYSPILAPSWPHLSSNLEVRLHCSWCRILPNPMHLCMCRTMTSSSSLSLCA